MKATRKALKRMEMEMEMAEMEIRMEMEMGEALDHAKGGNA